MVLQPVVADPATRKLHSQLVLQQLPSLHRLSLTLPRCIEASCVSCWHSGRFFCIFPGCLAT